MGVVAFRLDANFAIGHGHLSRCSKLARALIERGWEVHFLVGMTGPERERVVQDSPEYIFHGLPETGDERRDAIQCLDILREISSSWVIVDHYALGLAWEKIVGAEFSVAAIDDLDRVHAAQLIIDQNFDEKNYRSSNKNRRARYLVGPRYALLDEKLVHFRKNEGCESISRPFKVAITFGTYDQKKSADLVFQTYVDKRLNDVELTFFCGRDEDLFSKASEWSLSHSNIHAIGFLSDLPQKLCEFDVVLGAGGVSTLERLCLGIPSVIIATADNQIKVSVALAKVGAVLYLGARESVTMDSIASAIGALKAQPWLSVSLRKKGIAIVDGQGLSRVAAAFDQPYHLRKAVPEDLLSVHRWRNDPENQKFSIRTQCEITLENHTVWFNQCLEDSRQHLLIAEDGLTPVGVLRIDEENNIGMVSIYLLPQLKGQQRGQRCLRALEMYACQYLPHLKSLVAEIQEANVASIKCFEACDYELSQRLYTLPLIPLNNP